jgi:hypothetical protein
MNRFVLDYEPEIAAKYHCDKHVVKMILEEAQMLSTVHRRLGYDGDELYKAAFANHPCTVWAGETTANYYWSYRLLLALLDEYTLRYNKIHATDRLTVALAYPPSGVPIGELTTFPQAMPEDAKTADTVQAYRNYYILYKRRFATWKFTDTPKWWV